MIEREVISDEMTSGEAGCTCTRLEECAEGPCSDFRRPCWRARLGIGGGVVLTSIVSTVLSLRLIAQVRATPGRVGPTHGL
jgi:hypothetical protein